MECHAPYDGRPRPADLAGITARDPVEVPSPTSKTSTGTACLLIADYAPLGEHTGPSGPLLEWTPSDSWLCPADLEGINAGDAGLALEGQGQAGHKVCQHIHLACIGRQQRQALHITLLQEGPGHPAHTPAARQARLFTARDTPETLSDILRDIHLREGLAADAELTIGIGIVYNSHS